MEAQAPAARLLDRLIFLSDGVFAIAMTLLVVELVTPTLTSSEPSALVNALVALGPKYLSFGVSFLVIASYWRSHQRILSYLVRCDGRLVWLNLLSLLCIAFQPFPTSVLETYGTTPAVTLYAGTLAFRGTVVLVMWLYASTGHRLVRADLDARLIRHHTYRAASVVLVFLASIAIAQVNPTMAEFSCWQSLRSLCFSAAFRRPSAARRASTKAARPGRSTLQFGLGYLCPSKIWRRSFRETSG